MLEIVIYKYFKYTNLKLCKVQIYAGNNLNHIKNYLL